MALLLEAAATLDGIGAASKVEAAIAGRIYDILCRQLARSEREGTYNVLSRSAMRRHTACVMLGKDPTYTLTQADMALFDTLWRWVAVSRGKTGRPTLDPVAANQQLREAGSSLRVVTCSVYGSIELLLYEPDASGNVGKEVARTALLDYSVTSVPTAEGPIIRAEAIRFVLDTKWNPGRIRMYGRNPKSYGQTQQLAIAMLGQTNSKEKTRAFLAQHLHEVPTVRFRSERAIRAGPLTPAQCDRLFAWFQHYPDVRDMYALLVDLVPGSPAGPGPQGLLAGLLADYERDARVARVRLLLYLSDAWVSAGRLQTVLVLALCAAGVGPAPDVFLDLPMMRQLSKEFYALLCTSLQALATQRRPDTRPFIVEAMELLVPYGLVSADGTLSSLFDACAARWDQYVRLTYDRIAGPEEPAAKRQRLF
jgi:hypothetical protein